MKPTAYKGEEKNFAQVVGTNLPISRKTGREVAVFIKGKMVDRAISDLKEVVKLVKPVPFKRYRHDVPHQHGSLSVGRYPQKTAKIIIKLLESLKANAENKALDADNLMIVYAACQHAPKAWHYGRQRRRQRKLAHFELIGAETEAKEKKYGKKEKKE